MKIVRSIEDQTGAYCVDFIEDEADRSFTFKVFRKEPEDYGRWSVTADYTKTRYQTLSDAAEAAGKLIPWLDIRLLHHHGSWPLRP